MAQRLALGLGAMSGAVLVFTACRVRSHADRRDLSPPHEDAAPPEEIDEEFDPLLARAKALSLHASRVAAELESQIAAVGRSAAPVETAPAPAVVVSKEEEDLVARARALLSDAEPAPAPTRVEPVEDDDLDIDMDLIRRARALRGASQLARTESK